MRHTPTQNFGEYPLISLRLRFSIKLSTGVLRRKQKASLSGVLIYNVIGQSIAKPYSCNNWKSFCGVFLYGGQANLASLIIPLYKTLFNNQKVTFHDTSDYDSNKLDGFFVLVMRFMFVFYQV